MKDVSELKNKAKNFTFASMENNNGSDSPELKAK